MTPAIELRDICFERGEVVLLEGVDLAVAPGELLVVAGASGSGKTTLLRVVLGLEAPSAGTVHIGGREATAGRRVLLPPEERGLAVVFQDLALWPHLTAGENLDLGLRAKAVPRAERRERARAMLERVGLGARLDSYPGELSGGERQRVAIARALVLEPRAVLLDEPLANLDVALKQELLALFRELLQESRVTAMLVTHDPAEAAALGNRIALLEAGRISRLATIPELVRDPGGAFGRAFVRSLRET